MKLDFGYYTVKLLTFAHKFPHNADAETPRWIFLVWNEYVTAALYEIEFSGMQENSGGIRLWTKGNSKREAAASAAIEIIRAAPFGATGCPMNLTALRSIAFYFLRGCVSPLRQWHLCLFNARRCSHFVCQLHRRSTTYSIDAADRYALKKNNLYEIVLEKSRLKILCFMISLITYVCIIIHAYYTYIYMYTHNKRNYK